MMSSDSFLEKNHAEDFWVNHLDLPCTRKNMEGNGTKTVVKIVAAGQSRIKVDPILKKDEVMAASIVKKWGISDGIEKSSRTKQMMVNKEVRMLRMYLMTRYLML